MSPRLELPHTNGCLVCGRNNPFGLKMSLFVDPATGLVTVDFNPRIEHVGFEGVIHGGMIATVFDEAMVWAATWAIKRFCVCGEIQTRFRRPAGVGEPLHLEARVEFSRPKIVSAMAKLLTPSHDVVATAEGKYVPMSKEASFKVTQTFVDENATREAASVLRGMGVSPVQVSE